MPEGKTIKLTPAKGRPMLQWVGKHPLERVTAFPAQHVEKFAPVPDAQGEGLIFHGDNKDVLAWLLANGYRGKIDLVYIDPPFDSGADYVRKVELRGLKNILKVDGESHTLGEQIQYTDIWANDNYLQFMFERLLLIKELLSTKGGIFVHSDSHKTHHLRCLLDEVFGAENFKNDIIWQRFNYRADGMKFGTVHDTILYYTKSNEYVFIKPYVQLKPSYIKSHFRPDETGRLFRLDNLTAPSHGKPGKSLLFGDQLLAPPPGTMWRHAQHGIDELWKAGLIVIPDDGGVPQVKRYLDEIDGQAVHSIWTDLSSINSQSDERSDYPTQKPEVLLERIIAAASNPGDLILDCFAGSGTTAAVAQQLGRRWIIADINKGAIQTASMRLQRIIQEQIENRQKSTQLALLPDDSQGEPLPAQLAFSVYRVNDYDLQIQHNEALNLAIDHVGIERLKGDAFFEGTLGKRLVKIIPLNHPLTRLDLQTLQDELKKRPDEERDIVVVCLGKELAADAWLADYNHRHPVNKISVIELRTDPRYGKFFEHQPASVEARVTRQDGKIVVDIEDFISPTILERLEMDAGMFKAQITDWRAMVDTILIDAAYDGQVFNILMSDVPERKSDLVLGHYELLAPAGETTVAVKIIDMLGEEVLFTSVV